MYFRSLCIFYPYFSQNDRYLVLTAKLLDAKAAAALAKEDGDKKGQKEATTNIRTYSQGTALVLFTNLNGVPTAQGKQGKWPQKSQGIWFAQVVNSLIP